MAGADTMPESNCPNCGKANDRATSTTAEDFIPEEGDIAICIGCAHVLAYDVDLGLREATEAELAEVAGNPDLLRAMELVRAYRDRWESGHAEALG